MSEEGFADHEARDIQNEAFWNKLSEVFQDTIELLKDAAQEHGIDLEALDTAGQTEDQSRLEEEMAESHSVCRAAKIYINMVEDWFKSEPSVYTVGPTLGRGDMGLEKALEVIRWYQHFIFVKLIRAVRGDLEERRKALMNRPGIPMALRNLP